MQHTRRLAATLMLGLGLALGSAPTAQADLVIQGRAAQALHCAAMLFMVSDTLLGSGYIDSDTAQTAKRAAVQMLDYVPGSNDEKVQAMAQRFNRLMATRSMDQVLTEYRTTSKWCRKTFPD